MLQFESNQSNMMLITDAGLFCTFCLLDFQVEHVILNGGVKKWFLTMMSRERVNCEATNIAETQETEEGLNL